VEELPEPNGSLRAVYMGDVTPRAMAQNVTRFGLYADQVLIFNPLRSPHTFSDEYNPVLHPEQWLPDTLKLAYFLVSVSPWVGAGLLELIPSPFDYNDEVRKVAMASAEKRFKQPQYAEILAELEPATSTIREDWERAFFRTPDEGIAATLRAKGEDDDAIREFLDYVRADAAARRSPLPRPAAWATRRDSGAT
jgi:hypothetical protein